MNYNNAVKNIRDSLTQYINDSGLKSLIIGISGGLDSTLVAALAKPVCDDLNIPLIGRSLPTKTNTSGENSRADNIGKLLCHDFNEIDINWNFHTMARLVSEEDHDDKTFSKARAIQNGNIKARLRMIYLYDLASVNKGLVLSTDNWTEYLLGFWTLHGDSPYDWAGIQELWKTEVYGMMEWIMENEYTYLEHKNIIKSVLEADATDGLGISNTDLDQIMPDWKGNSRDGYAKVDEILRICTKKKHSKIQEYKDHPVIKRHLRTEFKRNWPYNISLSDIEKQR